MPLFILRPTSVRMWHKAVFKVGPVAGPKPNVTGSSKNTSDPVGIPLFGAPGDKPKWMPLHKMSWHFFLYKRFEEKKEKRQIHFSPGSFT